MAHLEIPAVAGDQGARTVELLGGTMTLGRAEGNDIVVVEGTLSRRHCEFFAAGGGWGVRDLGSGNGVKVGGRRVGGDAQLSDGDTVQLGNVALVYRAAGGDADDDADLLGADTMLDDTSGPDLLDL